MSERFLYGTDIANTMVSDARLVFERYHTIGKIAHFTTVLVGDDPASKKYIDMKQAEGNDLGVAMSRIDLPEDVSQEMLNGTIRSLSEDAHVHAVLVQYPLPTDLNYLDAIKQLDPYKDVDGLHPFNLGLLFHDPEDYPGLIPCTPNGIIQLLRHGGVDIEGADIAVVGRGMTVGGPLSMLLSAKHNGPSATVTTLHRRTKDLAAHLQKADVIIGATGVPELITGDMVQEGATLVAVGVSYNDEGKARGDFTIEARGKAGTYVPVTGGIGPMTRANLWRNVIRCYELQQPQD